MCSSDLVQDTPFDRFLICHKIEPFISVISAKFLILQAFPERNDLVTDKEAEIPIAIIALVVACIVFYFKDKKLTNKYYGAAGKGKASKKSEK